MKQIFLIIAMLLTFGATAQEIYSPDGANESPLVLKQPASYTCPVESTPEPMSANHAEPQWGEWYLVTEGMAVDYDSSVFSVCIIKDNAKTTLWRRDESGGGQKSQLKLCGAFEKLDFVMDYNSTTGEVSWQKQQLGITLPEDYRNVGYISEELAIAQTNMDFDPVYRSYTPGAYLNLAVLLVRNTDYGNATRLHLVVYDKKRLDEIESIKFSSAESIIHHGNSVTMSVDANSMVKKVSTVMAYCPSGNLTRFVDNGTYRNEEYYRGLLEEGTSDKVKAMYPGQNNEFKFLHDGIHYIFYRITFNDGRTQTFRKMFCAMNPTPEKWQPLGSGKGRFTDRNILINDILEFTPAYSSAEVSVEYNVDNPMLIRVVNPFTTSLNLPERYGPQDLSYSYRPYTISAQFRFDRENDYYLIFDTSQLFRTCCYSMPLPWWDTALGAGCKLECYSVNVYSHSYAENDASGKIPLYINFENQIAEWNVRGRYSTILQLPDSKLFALSRTDDGNVAISMPGNNADAYYVVSTFADDLDLAAQALDHVARNIKQSADFNGFSVKKIEADGVLGIDHVQPEYARHYYIMVYATDKNRPEFFCHDMAELRESRANPVFYSNGTLEDSMMKYFDSKYSDRTFDVKIYADPDIDGVFFIEYPYEQWRYNSQSSTTAQRNRGDRFLTVVLTDNVNAYFVDNYRSGITAGSQYVRLRSDMQPIGEYDTLRGYREIYLGKYTRTTKGIRVSFHLNLLWLEDGSQKYFSEPGLREFITVNIPYKSSGVENICTDGAEGEVRYYNLQGIEVADPQRGVYIRRCGNHSEKIVL